MVALPSHSSLPIEKLSASFSHVTNSYKFYWLLAILECIRAGNSRIIPIQHLIARMVANVWYPTNYFRLSFGKQDRLGQIAIQAGQEFGLTIDAEKKLVIQVILDQSKNQTPLNRAIQSIGDYVPYRFLRPFFEEELRGLEDWKVNQSIVELANRSYSEQQSRSIYRILATPVDAIEISPFWFEYLQQHLAILTSVRVRQANGRALPDLTKVSWVDEHRRSARSSN